MSHTIREKHKLLQRVRRIRANSVHGVHVVLCYVATLRSDRCNQNETPSRPDCRAIASFLRSTGVESNRIPPAQVSLLTIIAACSLACNLDFCPLPAPCRAW
jgi:hypothetical protein